jgi:hypothetical protein
MIQDSGIKCFNCGEELKFDLNEKTKEMRWLSCVCRGEIK